MTTTVPLPLTWADIQAMRPSARRDELAYAWRRACQTRRENATENIRTAYDTAAHAAAILATLPRDDDTVIARRHAIAASAGRAGAS